MKTFQDQSWIANKLTDQAERGLASAEAFAKMADRAQEAGALQGFVDTLVNEARNAADSAAGCADAIGVMLSDLEPDNPDQGHGAILRNRMQIARGVADQAEKVAADAYSRYWNAYEGPA